MSFHFVQKDFVTVWKKSTFKSLNFLKETFDGCRRISFKMKPMIKRENPHLNGPT